MTRRYLAYMMAPVSPSNGRTIGQNVEIAKNWFVFLREMTADLPITITCPWLVGILLGDDDNIPEQRERGLVDSETGASRCDLTIAVGDAPTLTTGMRRDETACPGPCVDLMQWGQWGLAHGAFPTIMSQRQRADIRELIREALRALEQRADLLSEQKDEFALMVTIDRRERSAIAQVGISTHVRALLAILDEIGGYRTIEQQDAVRAARESL